MTNDAGPRVAERSVECPGCGRAVPEDGIWVTWCEGCDWNAVTGALRRPGGMVTRWRRGMAQRVGARTYDDLLAGRPAAPLARVAWVGVLLLCAVVLVLDAAVPVLLVGTVIDDHLGFWHWPAVVLMAVATYVVVPRPPRVPDSVMHVTRAEAPSWWALVDEVAAAVGVRPPAALAFDTGLNACVGPIGRRWTTTVVYGLPLLAVQQPQERVAVLAHELGHLRGGDVRRGVVAGLAMTSLCQVLDVLWPDAIDENPVDEVAGMVMIANVLRRVLALPVLGLLYVIDRLACGASPRQEYLADAAAARVAGTEATRTAVLRLLGLTGISARAQSAARRGEDVWEALASAPVPPERELARLLRGSELTGHLEDSTHPPTHLRARLLTARRAQAGCVVLDPTRERAIDAELAAVRDRLGQRLRDDLVE